jgi:protein TonB
MGRLRPLISAAEHVGEQGLIRARSPEMSDGSPLPPLPPLGDTRPTRSEDVPAEGAGTTTPLLLEPDRQSTAEAAASADGVKVQLTLPPADPESAPTVVGRHSIGHTTSVIAACGVHIAVLLALTSPPPLEYGSGGGARDAISVSIVGASAIDGRQVAAVSTEAAPSQVSPDRGEDTAQSAPTPERTTPQEPPVEQARSEEANPDTTLAAPAEPAPEAASEEASQITSPPKPPEETKLAAVEPPEKPIEDKPKEEAPTPPSPAANAAGGATADGNGSDHQTTVAAPASQGEIHAYGAAVQSALLAVDQREAKVRASALQAKGTVVVRLTLDDRGALVSAEIMKSSGRPKLDEAALLLIRLAAFPPPPPGLTADQRAYIAPIRFQ